LNVIIWLPERIAFLAGGGTILVNMIPLVLV
jgi:hypothetical protein